ncbi:protein lifeguard 1 [Drosophila eugracilis]|uniref:protein lifeguard 1 n=1 Tax=Drosophila eugracilis TaxID=29029 RepID=UPI0007E5C67E|nr:protein lifeguard 1 [Drosophila eugracilis]
MDLAKKEPGFLDRAAFFVLTHFLKSPKNNDRYPPIPLPAPPPPAQDASPESGIITHDLIVKSILFDDQSIRKAFVRKVFGILVIQLLFTLVVMGICTYNQSTREFMQDNFFIFYVAVIVHVIVMVMLVCVERIRRRHPANLICLAIFTVTMSVLLGMIASSLDSNLIVSAVAITTVLVAALCIYAVQTKYDYTAMGGLMVTFVMIIFILAVCSFWLPDFVDSLPISCLCAAIGSFFLIHDMQSIVGGNRAEQLDPEEYVFAALTLYTDVIRIFLYIIKILQKFN